MNTCIYSESVVQYFQLNIKDFKLHGVGGIACYICNSREVVNLDRDTFPLRRHLRDCARQGTLGEMPFFGEIP